MSPHCALHFATTKNDCCLGQVIFYTLLYDMNLGFYDSFCVCYFSDPCIVTIYSNPFIERVVVPHPVACFTGADNLEEELGDFAEEINSETDDYDVVEKCAELAHGKHHKMFALGRIVCAYLEQTLKTDTTSMVQKTRSVKTVSAREIVCSCIP